MDVTAAACEWGSRNRLGWRDNKNSADSVSLMSVRLDVRVTLEGGGILHLAAIFKKKEGVMMPRRPGVLRHSYLVKC